MPNEINFENLMFIEAQGRIRRFEKKVLKEYGLDITPKMLNYIVLIDSGKIIKQKELLDYLDVSKGTLSNMVKQLSDKGFIKSTKSKVDKRSNVLKILSKGRKALEINSVIRKRARKFVLSRITMEDFLNLSEIVLKMK